MLVGEAPLRLLAALLLLSTLACHSPEAAPAAAVKGPKLVLHFLDKDTALPLGNTASKGPWAFMNMGLWDTLDIQWKDGNGSCAVGRTAPDWLLLRDPEGEVHRLVLHGPGPGELDEDRDDQRMDPDDRDLLVLMGLAWVWVWGRR